MASILNMSDYVIDADSIEAVIETEYDDEILCAGWNPDIDLVVQHLQLEPSDTNMVMPADLVTDISELFLRRMYSYQE